MNTNDQLLFKIATKFTWWKPIEQQILFRILSSIHTLMYFLDCIGTLVAGIECQNF